MFEKMIAWFKPTKAEREEVQCFAERARNVEHGPTHEDVDGIVHTHKHSHADHERDRGHAKRLAHNSS